MSGVIGCLPWDWGQSLHDGQQHSRNQKFHWEKSVTQKQPTALHGFGCGFEPITTSGTSPVLGCQAINCASIPTLLKASRRAINAGVRRTYGVAALWSGVSVPGVNIPIPTTWMSRWFVVPEISSGAFHPACLNNGSSCLAKLAASSPPPIVVPKSLVPPGCVRNAATNAAASLSVRWRGFMRSLSSKRLRSAFAARSCCLPSSLLAPVRSLSNCLSCAACRSLMMFEVNQTPAPNANAKKKRYHGSYIAQRFPCFYRHRQNPLWRRTNDHRGFWADWLSCAPSPSRSSAGNIVTQKRLQTVSLRNTITIWRTSYRKRSKS